MVTVISFELVWKTISSAVPNAESTGVLAGAPLGVVIADRMWGWRHGVGGSRSGRGLAR